LSGRELGRGKKVRVGKTTSRGLPRTHRFKERRTKRGQNPADPGGRRGRGRNCRGGVKTWDGRVRSHYVGTRQRSGKSTECLACEGTGDLNHSWGPLKPKDPVWSLTPPKEGGTGDGEGGNDHRGEKVGATPKQEPKVFISAGTMCGRA